VRDVEAEYAWFFREEFPAVVRTVALLLQDVHRAEEIAQEAFIQLLTHWKKISRYERPDAWVRRVAVRLAVRTLRRDQLRTLLEAQNETPAPGPPLDVDVVGAMAKLPPAQRAAVVLFYFEDRPVSEVADILRCSQSTTKVHLHRARKRLGALLGEEASRVP
jgi:RNA polymerase sigma-70 factor (ECF subfamily)